MKHKILGLTAALLVLSPFSFNSKKILADDIKLYTINPIAHYEFNDAEDLGKDTAGGHDLHTYGSKLTQGTDGNGHFMNFATNSFLYADKEHSFADMLGDFTTAFKIKKDVTNPEWAPTIAFGNGYDRGFTIFCANGNIDVKTKTIDNVFPATFVDGNQWNDILVTFKQTEGILKVYVDGNEIICPNALPDLKNWSAGDVDFSFAIGGRWNLWSNSPIDTPTTHGSIRDVKIYNAFFEERNVNNYFEGNDISVEKRPIDWQSTFSNIQGKDGYYYCYGYPDKYRLLTWGYMNDSNDIGWRVGHDDWWQQVEKGQMSPGCFRWWTLKVWVADRDGVVSLEGDILKLRTDPFAMGDGIDTSIWIKGEEAVSHHFAKDEATPFEVNFKNISVKKGDTIVFALHAGEMYQSSNDYAAFRLQIFWEEKGDNYIEGEDLTKYLNLVETEADIIGVIYVPRNDDDFDKE